MSKKKLTRKRKKQLLAIFMATGLMAQTMIGTVGAFANENTENEVAANFENFASQGIAIPYANTNLTVSDLRFTSLTLNGKTLSMTSNQTVANDGSVDAYMIYGFNGNPENAKVPSSESRLSTITPRNPADLSSVWNKLSNYEYLVFCGVSRYITAYAKTSSILNPDSIGEISANNASVEYGSTWNDAIAKQVTGVKATDKYGNDVTSNVTISGDKVDTSKPGTYNIIFTSPETGKSITVVITVNSSTNPGGEIELKYLFQSKTYVKQGEKVTVVYSVENAVGKRTDKVINALTGKVYEIKEGTTNSVESFTIDTSDLEMGSYLCSISTEDSLGNMSSKGFRFIVADPQGTGSIDANDFELEYKSEWSDQLAIEKSGVKAFDDNGNEEEVSVFSHNVNTSIPGDYVVTFVSKSGKKVDVNVKVKEPSADLSSITAKEAIEVDYGSDWSDVIAKELANVKATDKDGKDETAEVNVGGDKVDTSVPNTYNVQFNSPSGKTAQTKVTVKEKQIIGSGPIIHATDKTYQEGETLNPLLGVTATDPEDGDLTNKVVADASGVNMSKAGDYLLKLSVTDSDGNTTDKEVMIYVVKNMTEGPEIKGAVDIVIDERSKFDPLKGVTAQDSSGNDITANLTYTGSVDTSEPGMYTIKYYVYDSEGRVATATRKVTVQSDDSKPVILANDLTIKKGSRFDPMLYVHAYDKEDGDITDKVKVIGEVNTGKEIVQRITYAVTDRDGNYTEKTISVNVVATIGNGPVINGADDVEINVGDDFDLLSGVTAHDEEDGDLTSEIKVSGVVNTGKADEYEVIYTVWDSDYNVETVVRKITVKNPVVAPTIVSDKEIHVDFGSDWSDEIAKTKAHAIATDGKGNDLTKDIVVTSNPVDTNKAKSYDVEFSITTDGGTQTSKTTVIVDEEEKDYLLDPYKYVIGGDTYVTGKAGADVKYVSLYREEGGKRTFVKRAPVIDGKIKDYANGLITSKEEVIYAVAEDANQKTIMVDGKAVEKQVELAMLGEEGDYRLKPDVFILGTEYITGVYDNEKANKLVLRVDGNIVNTNYPYQSVDTFKLSSKGTIISKDQQVDVLEYNSDGQLLVTRPVTIVEPGEIEYHLTANDYTVGEAEITGNYDNDLADKVKLIVDGVVQKQFVTDPTQNTYHIAAKSFIDSADHDVHIAEYQGNQELTSVKVNILQPAAKNYELHPDAYTLGQANVTGTWSSDDESVQQVGLFINGVRQSLGLANADGTFTLSTKGMITSLNDKVEVQFYTNAGKTPLGEKVPVTLQNDYKLAVDAYTLNDRVVTGTYDSRYTTDKDQIQIVIDGVAVKNINYAASTTAPGKGKEAFMIAATDVSTGNLLITDKGQNVVIRHLKDGEVVKEEPLVIK